MKILKSGRWATDRENKYHGKTGVLLPQANEHQRQLAKQHATENHGALSRGPGRANPVNILSQLQIYQFVSVVQAT